MKVYLHSSGCRLNQSEIETMGRQLLAAGHELVPEAAQADEVILNTCAVTREASRDARRLTRRFHRQNEAAAITVTGCHATLAPGPTRRLPGVRRVVPNRDKERLVGLLDPAAVSERPLYEVEPVLRAYRAAPGGHTRAFVKVQDGCDNRCTFCVTTVARGPGRSRPLAAVVTEVRALAAAGYHEVVLTGVHLGSYGQDLGLAGGLRALVAAILADSDVARLRLSSLEPWDIEPDFFSLWQDPRLMPHLHLPLQSGSDAVLRRMARRTRRAAFRALARAARAAIPGLNLTTDLIVGFPGESEADFAQSLALVATLGFGRLHVFPFSARPGTAAAGMPDQVPRDVKQARAQRMIALGERLARAFHRRHEGQVRPVLWEHAAGADDRGLRWTGYTDNYIRVTAHGPADLANRIADARLGPARAGGMAGVLV